MPTFCLYLFLLVKYNILLLQGVERWK